jgi:hypothetical protein
MASFYINHLNWLGKLMQMPVEDPKSKRLVGVFLLGVLLFNPPILIIFNRFRFLYDIPLLYLYAFLVWAVIILFVGLATRSNFRSSKSPFKRTD